MNTQTAIFTIPDMNCNNCLEKIKTNSGLENNGCQLEADFSQKLLKVSFGPEEISPLEIKKAIETSGYKVTKFSIN